VGLRRRDLEVLLLRYVCCGIYQLARTSLGLAIIIDVG
jgi:hypothetical protein